MQHSAIRVLAATFFLSLAAWGQKQTDFSGTWKMDVTRSESAHQDVPIGPVSLTIKQTAQDISIETRRSEANSSTINTDSLTFHLDGKESTDQGKADIPIKVKAHWDGPKLVTETEREMNGSTVTTMQVLQLSQNGKEVTIDKTLTVQHGYQAIGAAKTTGTGKDVFVKSK